MRRELLLQSKMTDNCVHTNVKLRNSMYNVS